MNLQFEPFSSSVEISFWKELSSKKLVEFRLSDEPQAIAGYYQMSNRSDVPSRFSLNHSAFSTERKHSCHCQGTLYNTNTVQDFKNLNKKAILEESALNIWKDIENGAALEDPTLLNQFVLCTFADLKKHTYLYWFGFPALLPEIGFSSFQVENNSRLQKNSELQTNLELLPPKTRFQSLLDYFNSNELLAIAQETFEKTVPCSFLLYQDVNLQLHLEPLSYWHQLKTKEEKESVFFGFIDPTSLPTCPGWPLRNLLILLGHSFGLKEARIVCFRDKIHQNPTLELVQAVGFGSKSLIFQVKGLGKPSKPPKTSGWETNLRGKMGPRQVDLRAFMDPERLAETSVDLNLRLMRWRQLPDLNTELLSSTKCLLIGAGTLGCNLARCLLGWGIRKFSLVDNSKVSYSNPFRQPLFEFKDCLDGGQPKAIAAAASLKRIFPGVEAIGYDLSVPMPGHPLGTDQEIKQCQQAYTRLEQLICDHDVIFLGTDSRESRWLPTVLGSAYDKMVINVALGFDTFLVMRHGKGCLETKSSPNSPNWVNSPNLPNPVVVVETKSPNPGVAVETKSPNPGVVVETKSSPNPGVAVETKSSPNQLIRLGCYFCNDVVAPDNSIRDRTLDQMCTVTRPGLAPNASSVAVELMVALLHHSEKHGAPADHVHPVFDRVPSMGLLPHQIRFYLTHYTNLLPIGIAFDKCTACSSIVVENYMKEKFDFILKVCQNPSYLEDLTGLTELQKKVEDLDFDMEDFEEQDDEMLAQHE